ncbi:MAG TPA: hypothetical protein EYQ08_02245 [Planctomycetes bacterium]|nr:hypothetical protein [Planctomycetota bacterium]HIK82232.1 hypothetical protein [Planctomycetota bacterium]
MSFDISAIPDLIGRFHPLMLHFPLGLLLWAGVLEGVHLLQRRPIPPTGPVSLPMVIPGAAFAVLASLSGWLLANPEDPDTALAWHRWLGIGTTFLALVTAGVGIAVLRGREVASPAYRLSLFLCIPILAAGGHIGGEMKWGEGFVEEGFEKVFFAGQGDDDRERNSLTQVSIDAPQEQRGLLLYHQKVRGILDQHCVPCHGPEKVKGELRLDTPDDLKDRQREIPLIVPGDPDNSLLVELLLLPADDEDRMPPPDEPALTEQQRRNLVEWVRAGAPWPAQGPKGLVGVAGPVGSPGAVGISGGAQDPVPAEEEEEEEDAPDEEPTGEDGSDPPPEILHFQQKVMPLFERHCLECHGSEKQKGKLRLDLRAEAFSDREYPTIVPGNSQESELIERVSLPDDDEDRMPPDGDRLTGEELALLRDWIDQGASWPEDEAVDVPVPPVGEAGVSQVPSRTPGQLPDMPLIRIEDEEIRSAVARSVSTLQASGVRVAPISRIDDAHEAVFRLLRKGASDEMVAQLAGLEPVLTRLDLAGTSVTARSIRGLWRFGKIRVLNLSETVVGDDEVAILASLPDLTVLNLFGTEVTDDCLALFERMPALRRVYLWRTAVTRSAVGKLALKRPDLLINIGVNEGPKRIKAKVEVETSGIWPGREAELAPEHVHDGSVETIWAGPEEERSGWVQLTLEEPQVVVGVRLDEGQFPRIQKFSVEVQDDSGWVELASGTTIGSKKELLFAAHLAKVIRIKILEAVDTPVIAEFDLLVD